MTEKHQTPKPDDRSDNVEKLQDMVQNTIQNIEEAHETMQLCFRWGKAEHHRKNKRREEAIEGFRSEIQDEAHDR